MSPLEYTLNSAAWSLVGVIMTLTYQRLANWWRGRNHKGQLPPISTAAYFGSLLLLFAIIATLFSYSGKVAAENNKKCQAKINKSNVAILNQLKEAITGKRGFIANIDELNARELLLVQRKRSVKNLGMDLNDFLAKQNALLEDMRNHIILPLSVCTDNKVPPNISPSDIVSTHSN
jgi:hypothetical protein